jgi:hypothetical protein
MLKEILSVHGKSGLFKRISQGKNMLIAESLLDEKRIPLYPRDKVISLGDITIFSTGDEDKPLGQIFAKIYKKESGKPVEIDASNPSRMKEYFYEIFPEFDTEKVYPSDIKKMLNWYNLLVSKGLTDFETKEISEEEAKVEEVKEKVAKAPKKAPATNVPKEIKKKSVDKSRRIKQG